MRNLRELDQYRFHAGESSLTKGEVNPEPHNLGVFILPYDRNRVSLRVIASNSLGWDHVSVSLMTRTPTWAEMEYVKRKFFLPTETAMQLHVPPSDHVNCHPYCLHLWRPHGVEIPRPPADFVGPMFSPVRRLVETI